MRAPALALAGLSLLGCDPVDHCEAVPQARLELAAAALSGTGLYQAGSTTRLAPGVKPYAPRFELWADGAEKQRWIFLPPGGRLDSTDQDFWQFPSGTKLWKQFSVGGKRIETRLMQKTGDGRTDWVAISYQWDEAQADATQAPQGVTGALGTGHLIPAADKCWACHAHVASSVLGFSAIQLNHDAPAGAVTLAALVDGGVLTSPPTGSLDLPGNPTEQAALGYLHANCGHCHNASRPSDQPPRCYNPLSALDLLLRVAKLGSTKETPTYLTAGHFAQAPYSSLAARVSRPASQAGAMPPLAREVVDQQGADALNAWVSQLPK